MNYKQVLSITITLIIFASCAKVVDEAVLWELKSQPVVFSLISPSHPVQVSLSQTVLPNIKTDSILYPEAKVFICGEDKKWILLARQSLSPAIFRDVQNEIIVSEGQTYYLRIELEAVTLTSKTTVPIQKGIIIDSKFTADKEQNVEFRTIGGTLNASLELNKNDQCILIALSSNIYTNEDDRVFVEQNIISNRLHIPDSINNFDLQLLTLDPYLAKYLLAKEIMHYKKFSEGNISVFTGTFTGLLPQYSNIENGVGLFGSFSVFSKNTSIIY